MWELPALGLSFLSCHCNVMILLFVQITVLRLKGTYPVQSSLWCNHRAIQLKKVSKNSEKNLECASQPTSSIYKISGSNSSSSRSYKKTNQRTNFSTAVLQRIDDPGIQGVPGLHSAVTCEREGF